MSDLYIISTPIGNLGDITYRAVEVMGAVGRILAEDTRRTAILLKRYGIGTPLVSAHAHNEAARAAQAVAWLDAGEDVGLVSDAGTPLLSDPGARIVQQAIEAGHRVVPIPGASAALAALVASGLETVPHTFVGFVPKRGQARKSTLERMGSSGHTTIAYEAPGRVGRMLADLTKYCEGTRRVVVAREVTKVHETIVRGTLTELAAYYGREPVRGEVVVLVAGRPESAAGVGAEEVRKLARALLESGARPREVARELASRLGLPRNQAYEITQSLRDESEGADG